MDEEGFDEVTLKAKIYELQEASLIEFFSFLLYNGYTNDEQAKEKSELIRDAEKDIDSFLTDPHSNIVLDFSELFQEINNDYKIANLSVGSKYENQELICENLSKKISDNMRFNNYNEIFIDLRLSSYDTIFFNQVYNLETNEKYSESKPLLSMMIYNYIKTNMKEKEVKLFSSYTEPERFIKEWVKVYQRIYLNNSNSEELMFYDRKGKKLNLTIDKKI